ncbi:Cysteine--tRNA ligase [Porphyridium purpureum]|uniref:cysteine--tRNA ligase n=1 Tax=Porphyridium purpureum TaxID=35688 RepID=A0A5J4YQ40_PORPP|nr:Cysteine--tRNA ligase [Porphyridium purpureum]|eukprot:POR2177..scf236_6
MRSMLAFHSHGTAVSSIQALRRRGGDAKDPQRRDVPAGTRTRAMCCDRQHATRMHASPVPVSVARRARAGAAALSGRMPEASPEVRERKLQCRGQNPALQEIGVENIAFYNTMSEAKTPFKSVTPGVVNMYTCGPTIYDFAHVGNFRAFLMYDILKRWLLYRGFEVNHVMNLTDVEDKIIAKVAQSNVPLQELTEFYATAFFQDGQMLNIIPADLYPRATEHIGDIAEMIHTLKERGFAYSKDGSTYFSVDQFPTYGKLVKLDRRQGGSRPLSSDAQQEGETETPTHSQTSDSDEYDKENAADFALWKAYKSEDGQVFWEDAELGKGRPGWHIECSCMAVKYLGETLDIHAGGIDLVFPHHENEIAQSEAACGASPFANFWLHNGFVNIGGEKMSKSLKNFRTLRQIVSSELDARAFRYLVVASQYRSTLNLTDQVIKAAKGTIRRLDALRARLEAIRDASQSNTSSEGSDSVHEVLAKVRRDFVRHMDDDLNSPRAMASIFELVNATEKSIKASQMTQPLAAATLEFLDDANRVLGIFYSTAIYGECGEIRAADPVEADIEITPALAALLKQRADARTQKDWSRADEIRDQLAAAGFSVKDTAAGPELVRLGDK